jgi:transglutaminase-like putative cysteine protease
MKKCSFDPEADAIILLDKAVVYHDEDYQMITERRIRIKILNEKGIDRADIVIPYRSKDAFENISKIEAYTYNFTETGQQTSVPVDKKSIYNEKRSVYYSIKKFAMPAVKVGSIIEYYYVSTMKHYGGLEEWEFQSDIPTVQSSFFLEIIPGHEFTYTIQKNMNLNIIEKPMPSEGKVYYEMNNIPGLRFEPYMDAPKDYIQKVMFQHSAYTNAFGSKQEVNTTWKSFALELMSGKEFGAQLDKDLKIDEIKLITQTATTEQDKLKAIYDYVKKNIAWNGYDGIYAIDGLKTVWDRKKGNAGEINLLLVNLLNSAGIETYPVLAAERDFGLVDTTFPFIDNFNKTIAFSIADGKQFLLDASQENCPAGLTPYPILGTRGFIVDKKKFNLIKIASGNKSYKNIISINGTMDTKGLITAEAKVKSYDYARQQRLTAVQNDKKKFISDNFEKPYDGLSIDSFLVTTPDRDSIPLEQIIRYKQQLNESGGLAFLNSNLFTGREKNPFISAIRFTNVNFGYPYDILLEETFKLPAGIKIDLPEDKNLLSGDKKIQAVKQVRFENGELKIFIHFQQLTTLVRSGDYAVLKSFYKDMVDMLNEPIVLKLPN